MNRILIYSFLVVTFFALVACQNNKKVIAEIRVQNPSEMNEAITALDQRMKKFGVIAKVSQKSNEEITIALETKGDLKELEKNFLLSTKLEFYETESTDWVSQEITDHFLTENVEYPKALDKIKPVAYTGSPIIGYATSQDTLEVMTFLKSFPLLKASDTPARLLKLKWGILDKEGVHALYLLKTNSNGGPTMAGDFVVKSTQDYDVLGSPSISIEMSEPGAKKWESLTRRANENRFQIAIVLDGLVYSAPGVTSAISGGRSQISGDFTVEEAQRISTALNLGYLPKMELLSFEEIKE